MEKRFPDKKTKLLVGCSNGTQYSMDALEALDEVCVWIVYDAAYIHMHITPESKRFLQQHVTQLREVAQTSQMRVQQMLHPLPVSSHPHRGS